MKNLIALLIFVFFGLSLLSCNDDSENNTTPLPKQVFLEADQEAYTAAITQIDNKSSDEFVIDSFFVDADYVFIVVQYSGGCEDHLFEIYWDGIETSNFYNIAIVHDGNGDMCKANIIDTIKFEKEPFNVSEKAFEFIYGLGQKYTLSLGGTLPEYSIATIETGTQLNGFCTGTCYHQMLVDPNIYTLWEATSDGDTTITKEATTVTSDWQSLLSELVEADFFALENTYSGCNGCDDGAYEWIAITKASGERHKVTFEQGDTLSEIKEFHLALKSFGDKNGF